MNCLVFIKTYFLGGHRTSFLFEISLSSSVRVQPLSILTDTSFDAFHWLSHTKHMHYCMNNI